MSLIFLRHPSPKVAAGTCYGQTDLDIAEEGHAQIEAALTLTPPVTRILASPALRCRKLALAIADRDGIEPEFDARLWEMHMGDFEGLLWRDIPRELSEAWLSDPFNNKVPGGESFRDVQLRVLAAIASAEPGTAIVCHAGPIRAVQMAWTGISFADAFAQTPPYAEPVWVNRPVSQA
ncbi:MAG: histidine phosphatase family protein [Nitratireductor sp.]|nr:histidine phosphatase family protein [Nitratireductor sp.]MCB1458844.1 histidine phosphatase family protein [Nitratireductor sp.]